MGAAKPTYEVGIFLVLVLVLVLVLFFRSRQAGRYARLERVYRVRATSRRRHATTTDERFVRLFILFAVLWSSFPPFQIIWISGVLPIVLKLHAPALEREHWSTSYSTLNSHHGPRPIPTQRTCQCRHLSVLYYRGEVRANDADDNIQ